MGTVSTGLAHAPDYPRPLPAPGRGRGERVPERPGHRPRQIRRRPAPARTEPPRVRAWAEEARRAAEAAGTAAESSAAGTRVPAAVVGANDVTQTVETPRPHIGSPTAGVEPDVRASGGGPGSAPRAERTRSPGGRRTRPSAPWLTRSPEGSSPPDPVTGRNAAPGTVTDPVTGRDAAPGPTGPTECPGPGSVPDESSRVTGVSTPVRVSGRTEPPVRHSARPRTRRCPCSRTRRRRTGRWRCCPTGSTCRTAR
ncbi:hypothetical protein FEF34_16100 [Streptomyces marianii]|uniref:Uncharacterized protein n=1 Tax=Streptomyces marianii TaxID=1817406 RepID=A0A5R9E3P2_9ACTN|nr:hypothetical protein FEF34_16100 [Streptomyces marianii]